MPDGALSICRFLHPVAFTSDPVYKTDCDERTGRKLSISLSLNNTLWELMAFISTLPAQFSKRSATRFCVPKTPLNTRRFNRFQNTSRMSLTADLDHIALDCIDQGRMHKFYTTVLNFTPVQIEAPFPSARVSDITILDFLKSDKASGISAGNHFCFCIGKDDFPALKGRLEQAGIHVKEPVIRAGARGDGNCIYVRDPEQNMIEFRWYD